MPERSDSSGAILVTGAAGFVGSTLARRLRRRWPTRPLVAIDALTYAGDRQSLAPLDGDPAFTFVHADIADREAMRATFAAHRPQWVFHLAAETHVDRSILDPLAFVRTNVEGTASLLHAARQAWGEGRDPRFVMVSTDEVYGALGPTGAFRADSPLDPSSPYSASKAGADLLALAWHRTYGLPVVVTRCSNNYGPRQFPEKLIPVVVGRALAGEVVPVYGTGDNVRDWIHVDDHADGLIAAAERGAPGAVYCFGADNEQQNLALVHRILDAVDGLTGRDVGASRALVRFVTDRPGHDFRYAIDADETRRALGWAPRVSFAEGLAATVRWFIDHADWCRRRREAARRFEEVWYSRREAGS